MPDSNKTSPARAGGNAFRRPASKQVQGGQEVRRPPAESYREYPQGDSRRPVTVCRYLNK